MYIKLVIIILICLFFFNNINRNKIILKSKIDNVEYNFIICDDLEIAVNVLDKIREKIFTLEKYLLENIDSYIEFEQYILKMSNFKNMNIYENYKKNSTSYIINKKKLYLCIRSKINKKVHDDNILYHVLLHEITHLISPNYGHDFLFRKIFNFLIEISKKLNLYNDSDIKNKEYCGIMI